MNYLENKYVNLVSWKLRNFKHKSNSVINMSCPYCGDSNQKKNKARGYILEKNSKSVYYCHNCNITKSIEELVKFLDSTLYSEMIMEKFNDSKQSKEKEEIDFSTGTKEKFSNNIFKGLKKVSQLSPDHKVKIYIQNRLIPSLYHYRFYYCPKFMTWVNTIIPNKFSEESLLFDEPRLIIPFWDNENKVHAFQGRSFKKNADPRYITIILDDSIPKIYGIDTVNVNKHMYVTEGPIDSLFLPNALATAGGDIVSALEGFDKEKITVVYDNEPRSKETIHKLDKAITLGYNICIFPDSIVQKDINLMRLAGLSRAEIKTIIDNNTYKGLEAKLKLSSWAKV